MNSVYVVQVDQKPAWASEEKDNTSKLAAMFQGRTVAVAGSLERACAIASGMAEGGWLRLVPDDRLSGPGLSFFSEHKWFVIMPFEVDDD